MEFGIFTSGYQRFPLERAFQDAVEFGYDYVELWGGRPHAYPYDKESIENVKELIDRYQIEVKVYTPEMNGYPYNIMSGTEKMRQDAIRYTKAAMDFAKAIGAEYTLISAGHAGYTATQTQIEERLYRSLQELVEYAEILDHKIMYEPLTIYESNVTTDANHLLVALETIDNNRFVGMADILVPFIQGENILSYLDKLEDRLVHLHVIDSDGLTESHMVPGEGVLPLPELMKLLEKRKYEKTITIELVTNYLSEPSIYSKKAIDHLKSLL